MKIADEIKEILVILAHTQRGNMGNPDEYIELLSIDEALKEILKLKVKLPKKRLVQIGDSDNGAYRSKGYVECGHKINLSRGDRLCIECANDRGYNQALEDVTKLNEE